MIYIFQLYFSNLKEGIVYYNDFFLKLNWRLPWDISFTNVKNLPLSYFDWR